MESSRIVRAARQKKHHFLMALLQETVAKEQLDNTHFTSPREVLKDFSP